MIIKKNNLKDKINAVGVKLPKVVGIGYIYAYLPCGHKVEMNGRVAQEPDEKHEAADYDSFVIKVMEAKERVKMFAIVSLMYSRIKDGMTNVCNCSTLFG